MWNDNESAVDLLGFEYLVDTLDVLLTEPELLPLTVGVVGDWGSGKSSLMRMAAQRLREAEDDYIVVEFNPWRYEDFSQVKTALMTAVLDAVQRYAESDAVDPEQRKKILEGIRNLRPWVAKMGVWLTTGAAVGAAIHADPSMLAHVGDAAEAAVILGGAAAATSSGGDDTPDADAPPAGDERPPTADPVLPEADFQRIATFHQDFEALVEDLGDRFAAVVVFIDDMDRCTVDTILDTFETIRLFLNAPRTAYVVGAHEDIIAAALETRYPGRQQGDRQIARHYLEKMLQASVAVPPLSEPETLTYIALLYAQRQLGANSDEFMILKQVASHRQVADESREAMNVGIARDALGTTFDADIEALLLRSERIGPPIAQGLRGNPRQIKRFLNRLELRLRVAERRKLKLDPEVLAKVMVLEETAPEEFERLFHWQIDQSGRPSQLREAEAVVRDGADPAEVDAEAATFAARADLKPWLGMDPRLRDESLGPYFTFSRDRLKRVARAGRLTQAQQNVFDDVVLRDGAKQETGVAAALTLDPQSRADVVLALLDQAMSDIRGPAATGLLKIAAKDTATADAFVAQLQRLRGSQIPGPFVVQVGTLLKKHPGIDALLTEWAKDPKHAKSAVKKAREAL